MEVNLNKRELIPIGEVSSSREFDPMLGCGVVKFPTTILGLLVGTPFKSSTILP